MSVHEIDPRRDRQKLLRRILGRAMRSALSGEVVGYALVTWSDRGDAHTSYCTNTGPIGQRLMPAFVHDALLQHVAVDLSQASVPTRIDGK